MEVKYQIFVSSTYEDLKEERATVMETILKLEHIPIGMEMFNAGDEEQWELIKRTIDNSDYYVVIIGDRYGSIASDGTSYTEKEYNYAVEKQKPVLTFIKRNQGRSEESLECQYHLEEFKKKAKNKIASFWENKDELGTAVAASLVHTIKRKPGIGWIKADDYERQRKQLTDLLQKYTELYRLKSAEASQDKSSDAIWANDDEIKNSVEVGKISLKESDCNVGGFPLIVDSNEKEVYVDNSEAHSLIIGATGSGKTRRVIMPLINILAMHGESMVITDPKGELYTNTKAMLIEHGYKITTINLRDPNKGNAWNPLKMPYEYYKNGDEDKAVDMLYELANNIFRGNIGGHEDPYWTNSAADYFCGLALAMFSDAEENEINLNTILSMDASGEEKIQGVINGNYIKEYIKNKEPGDLSYINASGTVFAPSDTKGSILSVFRQCIKVYASKTELSKMLGANDINLSSLGEEKQAVYIIMHDEKRTYHPLVSTFIKQCYEALLLEAQSSTGVLNNRVNFVLDEFANINPISDMSSMITAARSRNIRFYLVIQGINQLVSKYGDADSDVIKGNCGNWIYLASKELPILREISEICGVETVYDGAGERRSEKPLISVPSLLKMPIGVALLLRDRKNPYMAKLPDIGEYDEFQRPKTYLKDAETVNREKPALFDLKEFVDKRRKKLQEDLARKLSKEEMEKLERHLGEDIDIKDILLNV